MFTSVCSSFFHTVPHSLIHFVRTSPLFDISFFIHFSIYFIAFDGIWCDSCLSSKNILNDHLVGTHSLKRKRKEEKRNETCAHTALERSLYRRVLLIWIIPFTLWKCVQASILFFWPYGQPKKSQTALLSIPVMCHCSSAHTLSHQ